MATLTRLKLWEFYGLVVEVASSGPARSGRLRAPPHPRSNGDEEPNCGHPPLENALGKPLGCRCFRSS
jgi:error-prone DNA polymerase